MFRPWDLASLSRMSTPTAQLDHVGVSSPSHPSPKYYRFCKMWGHSAPRVKSRERSVSATCGDRRLTRTVHEANLQRRAPFETAGTLPLSVKREHGIRPETLRRFNDRCGMPAPAVRPSPSPCAGVAEELRGSRDSFPSWRAV